MILHFLPLPWTELAIGLAFAGALSVSPIRDPMRAWRLGVAFAGAVLACTLIGGLAFYFRTGANDAAAAIHRAFVVDELSAPFFTLAALVHFLTALSTGRTKMRRFSTGWSLASLGILLLTLACIEPRTLIFLLMIGTVPPVFELFNRKRPVGVYGVHMGLFALFLALGWTLIDPSIALEEHSSWVSLPLLAGLLIRCGCIPAHCWLTDWCENASFGNAILFITPIVGVYGLFRLVLPIAPDWLLTSLGAISLVTAIYASAMSVVQSDTRRFFAYLFLSHASLVLVGLELHTPISLTGAIALWMSASLSLAGFGLTLRALEARFGRLSLAVHHGLYEHSHALAVCFILTGLASVGFPGTLGFVASELLIDGAIQSSPLVGLGVALTGAMNGIAILRAYFSLFTGRRHTATVSLAIGFREWVAVLTLVAAIVGGGLYPQPGIAHPFQAAKEILEERQERFSANSTSPHSNADRHDSDD